MGAFSVLVPCHFAISRKEGGVVVGGIYETREAVQKAIDGNAQKIGIDVNAEEGRTELVASLNAQQYLAGIKIRDLRYGDSYQEVVGKDEQGVEIVRDFRHGGDDGFHGPQRRRDVRLWGGD